MFEMVSALVAGVLGLAAGPRIAWAIRAWPGHEKFHCDYLNCKTCAGGIKRGCYNAGSGQDVFFTMFSAIVAAGSVFLFGPGSKALFSWVFSVACLIVTVVDIRYLIIPDRLSITGTWLGILYSVLCSLIVYMGFQAPQYHISMFDSVMGALLGGGSLWLLGWFALLILKKEGMGGGDVKLLAAFGAWLGWKAVIGIVVTASFLGSIGGISSILYRRIRYRKAYKPLSHMIPFGPYLCIGFLMVFFFGLDPLYKLMDIYYAWLETKFAGG